MIGRNRTDTRVVGRIYIGDNVASLQPVSKASLCPGRLESDSLYNAALIDKKPTKNSADTHRTKFFRFYFGQLPQMSMTVAETRITQSGWYFHYPPWVSHCCPSP